MSVERPKPIPTPAAIIALRDAAAVLDVDDLVDLCYATVADELRVSIYLEALRGRAGEKAQVAACLLCFDLAHRGDQRRELELQVLLPALDGLIARDLSGERTAARELAEISTTVERLWNELSSHARSRDMRAVADLSADAGGNFIEVDLFGADDVAELTLGLEDIEIAMDLDDEVFRAFDEQLNKIIPPMPGLLFSADTNADLERLERLRELCTSFAGKLSIAAELLAMTQLFIATHTRALGLFSRRNRRRDMALADGLTALLSLPAPPELAAGWFTAADMPGSDDLAWPKMAEVLLELAAFVGHDVDQHPERYRPELSTDAWTRGVVDAFLADPASARVTPRLTNTSDRRRRR